MTTTKSHPRTKASGKSAQSMPTAKRRSKPGTKGTPGKTSSRHSNAGTKTGAGRKWSADVTKHSDAMDLKKGVFTSDDPKKIARSVERSAAESDRKKGSTEQSAMSMLNFYINRAGKNLPAAKKKVLNKAKTVLKEKAGDGEKKKSAKKG